MIRGHIDLVTPTRVEGWVYSPDVTVRGRRVYAYIDQICVGGGSVDVFREDLATAGLGDGVLGFAFDIHIEQPQPLGRLVLTFDACDFILPCNGAQLRGHDEILDQRIDYDAERALFRFMFEKGWIADEDCRRLSELARFGCSQVHLDAPGLSDLSGIARSRATTLLQLSAMTAREVSEETCQLPTDFGGLAAASLRRGGRRPPICALWSPGTRWLRVAEGSHRLVSANERREAREGMIEYAFGGNVLLLLNWRNEVQPFWEAQTSPVHVWQVEAGD